MYLVDIDCIMFTYKHLGGINMKKLTTIIILFSLCSLISCKDSNGNSSVIKTDSCLDFELNNLDGTINNSIHLNQSDSIKTTISQDISGKLHIYVKNTDTNEISYSGDASLTNNFTFKINKTGNYDFIIKGNSVTGNINFKKQ